MFWLVGADLNFHFGLFFFCWMFALAVSLYILVLLLFFYPITLVD
jgi:hypothetical protein